ncbi:MAG: MMPL family transporter [Treponema sp.]|nr:MMPL family transporter [Treponema sp.]
MEKLFRYPSVVVGVIGVITVFFALQLPQAELDNNNIRFLPKGDQVRVVSEYIDDNFGGSIIILVGLERPFGTVFDPVFLARLREFAEAVESVDFVKDVNSLMSTQYITGDSNSIIVTDLMPKDFFGTKEEITELKRRIASWDMFRGSIISDDLLATQVIVTLNVNTEQQASAEVIASLMKIRNTAWEMFDGLADVYVTGQPVINATINEAMVTDNILLIPLVIVVVLAILFFSFRKWTFVLLPLLTVVTAVVWIAGGMSLLHVKFSIITTLLPVILVAVGSAYGIHVITHYIKDTVLQNRILTVEEHHAIVLALMRKLIKPIFLAALTTFAGFASFCFTSIVPMREFGYFSSFGVIALFAIAVTLIPSLLLIRGPSKSVPEISLAKVKKEKKGTKLDDTIGNVFLGLLRMRWRVLCVTALVVALSIYGLSKVVIDNELVEFFQNDTDISRSDRFIREYFGGSKEISLIVETDTTEELLSPAVLGAIDGLSTYLMERVPVVGKVVGFTDIIKRINQVFNIDESPEGLKRGTEEGFDVWEEAEDDFWFGFEDTSYEESDSQLSEINEELLDNNADSQFPTLNDLISLLDAASTESAEMSGSAFVREIKRQTNYDGLAYYEIPSDPARYGKETPEELQRLVSNYLILLAGDENSGYSNDPLEPTALRTMIQLRTKGNQDTLKVIDTINAYVTANFPKNVRIMMGGGAIQESAVTALIVNSQIISIVISILCVFVIMAFSNKSLFAGLIGVIPISIAVLCNFAAMGFFGVKLNIATSLIASLAVGIGIDYTIHFIDFFKREYTAGNADFLRSTFVGCGKAILINAISVGAGFSVLTFSQFRILAQMGALIALSMGITALVSLTVIPVLLTILQPRFVYGKRGS